MGRGRSGAKGKGGGGAKVEVKEEFRQMTDAEETKYYDDQNLTDAQKAAFDRYTDPNEERGSLYNFSQNMNHAIANDLPLTREQQRVFNEINGSMHELGYNAELTRYDHADTVNEMLRQVGVSGRADRMTPDELKRALQGVSYKDKRILSTSVNGFKNSSDPTTFTTRQFKFVYKAKSGVKGVMPGVGKTPHRRSRLSRGDDFGEMLLAPGSKYKITDVRLSGARARRKGSGKGYLPLQQIEIVVEVG